METGLIERARINLDATPHGTFEVTHLTDAGDPRWTGIIDLGPLATYTLGAANRHDIYVLQGDAEANGYSLVTGYFTTLCDSTIVRAGDRGARLFVYREIKNSHCRPLIRTAKTRTWREGVNSLMQVAPLVSGSHHVSIVSWQPGARTRGHTHPSGEEIMVVSGELRDADERYPAGTWLRLHPGAPHAPFAEVPTVILLRHGHLPRET